MLSMTVVELLAPIPDGARVTVLEDGQLLRGTVMKTVSPYVYVKLDPIGGGRSMEIAAFRGDVEPITLPNVIWTGKTVL